MAHMPDTAGKFLDCFETTPLRKMQLVPALGGTPKVWVPAPPPPLESSFWGEMAWPCSAASDGHGEQSIAETQDKVVVVVEGGSVLLFFGWLRV